MKLKLDENVPAHLAHALQAFGHDVDSVQSEALTGHRDSDVWTAAQRDGRFVITQDLDFSDARKCECVHFGLERIRIVVRWPETSCSQGLHERSYKGS